MSNHSFWFAEGNYATAGSELLLTVWRVFPYGAETIKYQILAGTAVEDTDYNGDLDDLSGTLSFADEEVFKAIRINTTTGGSSGNRTVLLKIHSPSGGKVKHSVAEGIIQDGTLFFFAASAAGDGSGSSPANAAAFSRAALGTQINASSSGDGILFNRGDTFLWDQILVVKSDVGGVKENPLVIGAYGTGGRPILKPDYDGGLISFRDADSGTHDNSIIWQDFNPVPNTYVADYRVAFSIIDLSGRPCNNIIMQHMEWEYVSGNDNWLYLGSIQGGNNNQFRFNLVDGAHEVACFGSVDAANTKLVGNKILNVGTNATLDWGIYCTSSEGFLCVGNFLKDTIQGIKFRGGDGIICSYNHVEPRTNGTTTPRVGITYGGGKDSKVINGIICSHNVFLGASALIGEQSDGGDPADYAVIFDARHQNNFHWIDDTYYSPNNSLIVITHPAQIQGVEINNNTCVVDGKDFECFQADSGSQDFSATSALSVRNNLFMRINTTDATLSLVDLDDTFITHCTLDYNWYYDEDAETLITVDATEYTTVAAFNSAQSQEANGDSGAVTLSAPDDFPISVIPTGVGTGLLGLTANDLRDLLRQQPPTIGAWELNNAAVKGKFC